MDPGGGRLAATACSALLLLVGILGLLAGAYTRPLVSST